MCILLEIFFMQDLDILRKIENTLSVKFENLTHNSNIMLDDYYLTNLLGDITMIKISARNLEKINDAIPIINELKNLVSISLSNNELNDTKLKKINLKQLNISELDLSVNDIRSINFLKEVKPLKVLNLSENRIYNIDALKYQKELTFLELSNNQISNIDSLSSLRNLTFLSLFVNNLYDIEILSKLDKLEELHISCNSISDISPLSSLKHLKKLGAWGTNISDISALKNLSNLKTLHLMKNPIIELPSWITDFKMKIRWREAGDDGYLTLFDNNKLSNPPIDIVKDGKTAVKNYFSQISKEDGKIQYLYETKLLVIGEGGTGKTTFTRKMQDVNAKMPDQKDTTFGIDIGKWIYSLPPHVNKGMGNNFHVNLWDFGGQKIYQGTHQIFFSDKSFYVLIADTREQKTDFSYWLNTVEQLGGENSSLVIILNKKFGHEQKLDESGYKSHFGKIIKDIVEIDLQNDPYKLTSLQEKIKCFLMELPGIGDPLPGSWVRIREDLSRISKNFISFDEFRSICKKHHIVNSSMIHTLSGYFNRVGAITHFIDDPLLQERIYLNSNWLVKTVYEVIDNEIVKSDFKKGRLTEGDIRKIWRDNELHYEMNKLTQLMHKFGLMYHIPDSNDYVVPAHLPTITPYDEWPYAKDNSVLQFIYEFDKYMPQGIMSRLIVSLNHHIRDHNLVWHRGVNIEVDKAHAEIIESYGGNNRFEIRLVGVNKIELLSIIRERFSEVLKPFNGLKYKQLLPCLCDSCKDSSNPAFHDYNLLLKFRAKRTGSQCGKTGEIVNAEELLKIIEKQKPNLTSIAKSVTMRTITIFLASSAELVEDRKAFREFIGVENDRLHKAGIYLEIIQWEYFIDAMSRKSLQSEYNKMARESDIFVSLFFSKVGKFTAIEFENAFGNFKKTGKPMVFTYFKNAPIDVGELKKADINSKFVFEEKLSALGHFKTNYKDIDDLCIQFKRQLEKLLHQVM